MKKCLAAFACLILFSLVLIPRTNVYSQRRETAQRYADDRIIVKLKPGADQGLDADLMAEEIVSAPGVRAERLTVRQRDAAQLIHLNRGVSVEDAVRRAQQDPRVEYAEPDYLVYAMDTIPNDPFFNNMWGLSNLACSFCDSSQQIASIDATKAWDITTGNDNVVAVVLDTGVQLQHEDLSANAWVNPQEIAGNGVDDDDNGFVDDVHGWNFFDDNNRTYVDAAQDFHGTHVAGSIGAVSNNGLGVTGVAWHVKIMSLKFLGGTQGKGKTSDAIKGIRYAIGLRNRGVDVRVINASWGGGSESLALRQAISDANDAGILFVCAAGNDGENIDDVPTFPASYSIDQPNAISVGALNQGGSLASFSNFGHASVSVAAPGVGIFSTWPGSYNSLQGTSMSTPYVSGIAVLLWSNEPSLTPAQVKQRIIDTSQPLPWLVSMLARSGRASAYEALINRIPPVQPPEVLGVHFSKKVVTIDGFGFANGSSIIEVDGQSLPTVDYDSSFSLANGTLTQLRANLGKKPLKRTFPLGVQVSVSVFNPLTGERSSQFLKTRF
jgi:subtilisin family serine protease